MSMALGADAGLALLILGLAVWTSIARSAFGAAIGFMAYGLLVALVWVRLAAVDVALTEAALGSGLTGFLLLGAAARLPRNAPAARPGWGLRLAAGVLSAAVAAGLAAVVLLLPVPGPTLAPAAVANLPALGLGNPVTGVLIAYRAIDTLLESVVLVLALIGLWSLAKDGDWRGRPGLLHAADPNPDPGAALVLLAQVLPPLGILVGIHLFWTGAIAPGGAFQGGSVLAAMWVLTLVAGLTRPPGVGLGVGLGAGGRGVRLLLVVGPALFLAIGLAGFWLGGAFLAYPAGYAKPLILAIEAALTLSIAVALGLLLAGPPMTQTGPRA